METVTNFGDLAVILPAAVVAALGLLVRAGKRPAAIWLLAIGGCAALIGGLKMTLCCGWLPDLTSPSGHTAMSTIVYGGLGFLVAWERRSWSRALIVAVTVAAVGLIGTSRVAMGAHTPEEVVAGWIIGALFLLLLIEGMRRLKSPPRLAKGAPAIVMAVACTAFFFHGRHVVPHICLYCCGPWSPCVATGT